MCFYGFPFNVFYLQDARGMSKTREEGSSGFPKLKGKPIGFPPMEKIKRHMYTILYFFTYRDQHGMTGTSTRDNGSSGIPKLKRKPIGFPLCVFMFFIFMFFTYRA